MIHISHTFTQKQAMWIIASLIFLSFWIAISGEWLSSHLPDPGEWEVAFVQPQDDKSIDFFIFNASGKNTFTYKITRDTFVVEEGVVEVALDEEKTFSFEEDDWDEGLYHIEIEDTSGKTRGIYRQILQ
ncbi:MAG: hypothetical protein EOM19_00045 [Candidatus Moranbacteria bacterium]|nr:hypothetical protein [Candidatus Moranbacteria bacterium]